MAGARKLAFEQGVLKLLPRVKINGRVTSFLSNCDVNMEDKSKVQKALRITQLDAIELDDALFDLLKGQISSAFKYFDHSWLSVYGPEANAILKWVLWKYSVNVCESTVGQQLLELKYRNNVTKAVSKSLWMTRKQKLLYALLTIGLPYLSERTDFLAKQTSHIPFSDKVWYWLDRCQVLWKMLSLVNFLVFLTGGKYQILTERILGIQAVFPRLQGLRQVGFEYMERELLWHGFAEFLFFVVPLINFRRIKNTLQHMIIFKPNEKQQVRKKEDLEICVVCEKWPCNPMQIGCAHVFCYYCIQANIKADPSFRCPSCSANADKIEPVIIKVSINQ